MADIPSVTIRSVLTGEGSSWTDVSRALDVGSPLRMVCIVVQSGEECFIYVFHKFHVIFPFLTLFFRCLPQVEYAEDTHLSTHYRMVSSS